MIFIKHKSSATLILVISLILFSATGCWVADIQRTRGEGFETAAFLDAFSYSGAFLDISAETLNARATHWRPDGSLVFVTGRYTDNVAAYQVEIPWDLSTASFKQDVKVPGEFQHGLYLREDGLKMWVFDRTSIWSFDLATPWDITSISEGENTSVADFVERGHDIDFTPDGKTLFIDDRNTGAVFAVELATPWDVSSGTLAYTLDISDVQKEVRGIEFIMGGSLMLLMDTGRNEILQYKLLVPYDLSTATLVSTFDVSEQTLQGRGLSLNADYTSFYVTGRDEEKVFQYKFDQVTRKTSVKPHLLSEFEGRSFFNLLPKHRCNKKTRGQAPGSKN